jgi:hypothetical protein
VNILNICIPFLSDLPDLPPALLPAPAKRARPSPGHPLPHDEDPEERLNRHDQHITAVLSKIVVRVSPAGWGKASHLGEKRVYKWRVL